MTDSIADQAYRVNLPLLADIGEKVYSQDNACTSFPMVTVQERVRVYGFEDGYADGYEWYNRDDDEAVAATKAKRLEILHVNYRSTPAKYSRVGYKDHWEHVQTFFTVEAAKAFIERQRHNFRELRTYVESGHSNPEWRALLAILGQASVVLKAVQTLAAVSELALADPDKHKPVTASHMLDTLRDILRKGDTPVFKKWELK